MESATAAGTVSSSGNVAVTHATRGLSLSDNERLLAMKLLIVYGTSEGQTRKIAGFVAEHLAQQEHQTQLVSAIDATAAIDPRDFDAVIIAASVHAGRYQ